MDGHAPLRPGVGPGIEVMPYSLNRCSSQKGNTDVAIEFIPFSTSLSGCMSIFLSLITRRAAEFFPLFCRKWPPCCVIFVIYGTCGVAMN